MTGLLGLVAGDLSRCLQVADSSGRAAGDGPPVSSLKTGTAAEKRASSPFSRFANEIRCKQERKVLLKCYLTFEGA